jgi:hypothetical protein
MYHLLKKLLLICYFCEKSVAEMLIAWKSVAEMNFAEKSVVELYFAEKKRCWNVFIEKYMLNCKSNRVHSRNR